MPTAYAILPQSNRKGWAIATNLVDVPVLPRQEDAAVGSPHHLPHDDAVGRHPHNKVVSMGVGVCGGGI